MSKKSRQTRLRCFLHFLIFSERMKDKAKHVSLGQYIYKRKSKGKAKQKQSARGISFIVLGFWMSSCVHHCMACVLLCDDEKIILVSVVVNNRAQRINLPLIINNELDLYHKVKCWDTICLRDMIMQAGKNDLPHICLETISDTKKRRPS